MTPSAPSTTPAVRASVRVGDRERAQVADRLAAHAAAGRLTIEELEQRLERTHAAVFDRDLLAVEADLPFASTRRRAPGGPPLAAVALLVAGALASAVVGHPVVPLFLVAFLLWSARRRTYRGRLSLQRPLP
jgi:hypothetical protein